MRTQLANILSSITANLFSKPHILLQEDIAVFAGVEAEPIGNAYEFGIYVFPTSVEQGVWLPASAIDPEIIEKFRTMEVGQIFEITQEDNSDAMGTVIEAIEIPDNAPILEFEKKDNQSGFIFTKKLDFLS